VVCGGIQSQIHRQLPGHHFLITFTVPEQLRSFMRQHQRLGYSALFTLRSMRRPLKLLKLSG
jgi:hypothetical protein